jgi:thymidine kinase
MATLGGRRLRLAVFYGPMCAAKTDSLISLALALPSTLLRVVIASSVDTRGSGDALVSRTGARLRADTRLSSLISLIPKPQHLYVIDELQFFPAGEVIQFSKAVSQVGGSALLAAGLDLDFRGEPFGDTIALANRARAMGSKNGGLVVPLTARCAYSSMLGALPCGAAATHTQRLRRSISNKIDDSRIVGIGGEESYRPVCESHHSPYPVDGTMFSHTEK